MPLYTCFDMIRDCAAGRPEGWRFFVAEYAPVIRALVEHYFPQAAAEWAARAPEILRPFDFAFFRACPPCSERDFILKLRQHLLASVEADENPAPAAWDSFAASLAGLTFTEKQVVWLEVMGYGTPDSAAMMRMHPEGVERIRRKAAQLLREAGCIAVFPALRRAVAHLPAEGCCAPKDFFDWLDGRITWYRREDIERHASSCWSCVDLFCRVREALRLAQRRSPLPQREVNALLEALRLDTPRKPFWLRFWRQRIGA
ncbi:MAG TPA: hypothetical protein VNJ11_10420 [Bryobacteraceae bacterium]|nr:hypothetical protein [Bryobacteraceae bacterium]